MSAERNQSRISSTCSPIQPASVRASPASLQTKHDARVMRSETTYVRKPPESSTAFAPRCTDAVSPPSEWARGTATSSDARPVSTTSPSSDRTYSPSETWSCATETGITAVPVTDSADLEYGERSTSASRPSASRRAAIDAGSFLRGSRSAMPPFLRNLTPMPAQMIDGKALAAKVREEVASEVEELGEVGLATVLVGDDPASHVYITGKHKAATAVGIHANDLRLPAETPEDELLQLLSDLNADAAVDGILVQLPLPSHLDETKVIEAIAP